MERAAKIVLVNKEGEILLYLRDDKPDIPCPGYWDFFGGTMEGEESDIETVEREIKEELNIGISGVERIGEITTKPSEENFGKSYTISIFRGDVDSEISEIKISEGQRARFFRLDELARLKFPSYYLEFLKRNKEILKIK